MDFFRKYQRIILFTAGIFALVTFSISGNMLEFFSGLRQTSATYPTMVIAGRSVSVTEEDYAVAQLLTARDESRGGGLGDLVVAVPPLLEPDGNDPRVEVYAALRRLAIEYGIEYSDDEVEKAIQTGLTIGGALGATHVQDLRVIGGYSDLTQFRKVIGEALRIGTFVRMQALAIDTTDASLAGQLAKDVELLTVVTAAIDEKAIQTAIEQKDVSDDDLKTWINGLSHDDQNARGFLDSARYRVDLAWLELAAFDPAAFAKELGDKQFSEDEVKGYYELNKFRLYQKEKPKDAPPDQVTEPEYLELDEALKTQITKRLQAEAVLRSIWDTVTTRAIEAVKAENEAVVAAQAALTEAQKGVETAMPRGQAADATEDEKKALSDAEAAVTAAKAKLADAQKALGDKRAAFELAAVVTELAAGRAGVGVTDSGAEPLSLQGLQDLAPVAPWQGSAAVGALSMESPLSTQVQRSPTHAFQVRLRSFAEAPLKKFEDIREKARSDWFAMKAGEEVTQKVKDFEAKLVELAKAKIPERIAELEKQRDEKVTTRLTEWRDGLNAKLTVAKEKRDLHEKRDPKSQAFKQMKAEVERLEAELTKEEAQRKLLLDEVQKETDAEITKSSKAKYPEVLAEAAQPFGFVVENHGPFPRELFGTTGRVRDAYPEAVRFLWNNSSVTALKVGEATELLQDFTGRKRYLAAATAVEKGTLAQVTRRKLLMERESVGDRRSIQAIMQSFSLDALTQRYGWKRPSDTEIKPANN
ncbi:MAG: hypothetical protein IT457_00460 [Planctomycetes bacterium]|nr:hypothetical protein [Planctomycetota bacterium]